MNAINWDQIRNQAVALYNHPAIPTLSPLQKRIMTTFLGVLFCSIFFYVLKRCFKAKPLTAQQQKEKLIQKLGNQISCNFRSDTVSALCFVNMEFEGKNIKQQFIFKNPDSTLLTYSNYAHKIDQVLKSLTNHPDKNFGALKSIGWLLIFKSPENDFSQLFGREKPLGHELVGGTLADVPSFNDEFVMPIIGMPKGTIFIEKNEFIQGEFYKDLDI